MIMRVFNLLYSTTNLRCRRWAAVFLLLYSVGCSQDPGTSPNGQPHLPYGGASGTANTTYDSGVNPVQTGGAGGAAPVAPLDTGIANPVDSGANDSSVDVVDTGVVPLFDGAIIDAAPDGTLLDSAIPDVDAAITDSGNAPYSPCPNTGEPCRILPLGNSITDGLGSGATAYSSNGGYRVELFRKSLADNKNITFVGGNTPNGPSEVDGVPFPRNHEGHSGWTVDQIAGIVPSPALDGQPHIILLMIGTNDVAWANPTGVPQRLTALIDKIIAAAADALLVVAKITPLGSGNAGVEAYNNSMPAIIDERAARGAHIMLVDMYTGYPAGTLADGVHPNVNGYAFMAGVWYEAIKDVLP